MIHNLIGIKGALLAACNMEGNNKDKSRISLYVTLYLLPRVHPFKTCAFRL